MSSKLKNIAIVTTAVLVMAAASYGIWLLFFAGSDTQQPSAEPTEDGIENSTSSLPISSDVKTQSEEGEEISADNGARLVKISDTRVFDFWLYQDGEPVFIGLDGRVYKARPGEDERLSSQTISALNQVKEVPGGSRALVSFGDPKNPDWSIFNVSDARWAPLPDRVVNASWESNESLIIMTQDANSRRLERVSVPQDQLITEGGLEGEILTEDIALHDVDIESLFSGKVLITERPASFYSSRVWELDPETGQLSLIMSPTKGLWVDASLYRTYLFRYDPEDKLSILVPSDLSKLRRAGALSASVPSKCGDYGSYIYCGTFGSVDQYDAYDMPESYLQEKFFTTDRLRLLDVSTGELTTPLNSGVGDVPILDISRPKATDSELYFINRYDQGLYRLALPNQLTESVPEPEESNNTDEEPGEEEEENDEEPTDEPEEEAGSPILL